VVTGNYETPGLDLSLLSHLAEVLYFHEALGNPGEEVSIWKQLLLS
jgi:hypothetical protein